MVGGLLKSHWRRQGVLVFWSLRIGNLTKSKEREGLTRKSLQSKMVPEFTVRHQHKKDYWHWRIAKEYLPWRTWTVGKSVEIVLEVVYQRRLDRQ